MIGCGTRRGGLGHRIVDAGGGLFCWKSDIPIAVVGVIIIMRGLEPAGARLRRSQSHIFDLWGAV